MIERMTMQSLAVAAVLAGGLSAQSDTGNEDQPTPVSQAGNDGQESPTVYGWREWINFEGKKKAMRAKLDSGALTSSIHGENIKFFEKDGEKWVRFTVFDPNRAEHKVEPVRYECRITRVARIRNADGQLSERPVVEMDFWIGTEKRRAEFSLNDRGDMINPVLLGRSVIQTLGLIDTGKTYLGGGTPTRAPVREASETPAATPDRTTTTPSTQAP